MIQVIYRRGKGKRSQYHVAVDVTVGVSLTICGRWLPNASVADMNEEDWLALGNRRCGHCVRKFG
jgi:hypothetical protein